MSEHNVTEPVALPAGAIEADEWQLDDDAPHYRVVMGPSRGVEGSSAALRTTAIQFADGAIDDGEHLEAPVVHIHVEQGKPLNAAQARQLARLLTTAADEINRMRGD